MNTPPSETSLKDHKEITVIHTTNTTGTSDKKNPQETMPWHTRPPFAPAGALVFVANTVLPVPAVSLGGYYGLAR